MVIKVGDHGPVDWANGVEVRLAEPILDARLPLSAQAATLAATYGKLGRGALTIPLGDSIDLGNDIDGSYSSGSIYNELTIRSSQAMKWLRNAGIAGNTTTQALARIQSDVIAYNPGVCIIGGGVTNDMGSGWSGHTVTRTNLAAMASALRAAGIAPVLRLCPPADLAGGLGTVAARRTAIAQHNAWCRTWGPGNGVPILDYYAPLTDEATGGYVAAFTADGIHPNLAGCSAASAYVVTKGLPPVFNGVPTLTGYVGDGADLLGGLGLFMGTPASGIAGGWGTYGTSTNAIETDTTIPGNWQSVTDVTDWRIIDATFTTGFSVGDTLEFAFRVQKLTDVANSTVRLRVLDVASVQLGEISPVVGARTVSGIAAGRVILPAGTTQFQIQISVPPSAVLKVAQLTVSNLTALGIA